MVHSSDKYFPNPPTPQPESKKNMKRLSIDKCEIILGPSCCQNLENLVEIWFMCAPDKIPGSQKRLKELFAEYFDVKQTDEKTLINLEILFKESYQELMECDEVTADRALVMIQNVLMSILGFIIAGAIITVYIFFAFVVPTIRKVLTGIF